MKRARLILILSIAYNISCWSQSFDFKSQYDLALHLYQEKEYQTSLKEYLRLYYLDKENKYPSVCQDIAFNFLVLDDHVNALKFLDLYYFKTKDENEKNKIRYEKNKIYLIQGDYKKALVELLQVNKKNYDVDKYNFMLASTYLFNDDYEKAKVALKKLSYSGNLDTVALNLKIQKLISNNNRNPKNARWLSTVMPGLGQAINGDIKDGLNSIGLYAGFLYLFFDISTDIGTINSAVSVLPWMGRYYMGGLQNSVKSAEKNKYNKKQDYIQSIINIVKQAKNK